MPIPPFRGSITALITPFKAGKLDERANQRHVEWQIDQGTHGLVPCGTTGESPTLSHDEHKRVVELCVEAAAGRVPVIAGTGSNSTHEAIELSVAAKRAALEGAVACFCSQIQRSRCEPSTGRGTEPTRSTSR